MDGSQQLPALPSAWRFAIGLLIAWTVAGWAQAASADEGEDQFRVASGHYAAKRWQFAVEEFDLFLTGFPEHSRVPVAHFYLGDALVHVHQADQAQAHFAAFLKAAPEHKLVKVAKFRLAEAAYLLGEDDEAQALLDLFLAEYPQDTLCAFAWTYRGNIALVKRDWQAAREYFTQGAEQFPAGPTAAESQYGLALAQEHLGMLAEARRGYVELAEGDTPFAVQAMLRQARLQKTQGQLHEAQRTLEKLNQRELTLEERAKAQLQAGWIELALGNIDQAQSLFAKLTLGEPAAEQANTVDAHAEAPNAEDAPLGETPAAADTLLVMEAEYGVLLCVMQRSPEEGLAIAQGGIQRFSQEPHAYLFYLKAAECQQALNAPAEAAALYGQVLTRWPKSSASQYALLGLMDVAGHTHDERALLASYEQLQTQLEGSPLLRPARRLVAQSYLRWQQPGLAKKWIMGQAPLSADQDALQPAPPTANVDAADSDATDSDATGTDAADTDAADSDDGFVEVSDDADADPASVLADDAVEADPAGNPAPQDTAVMASDGDQPGSGDTASGTSHAEGDSNASQDQAAPATATGEPDFALLPIATNAVEEDWADQLVLAAAENALGNTAEGIRILQQLIHQEGPAALRIRAQVTLAQWYIAGKSPLLASELLEPLLGLSEANQVVTPVAGPANLGGSSLQGSASAQAYGLLAESYFLSGKAAAVESLFKQMQAQTYSQTQQAEITIALAKAAAAHDRQAWAVEQLQAISAQNLDPSVAGGLLFQRAQILAETGDTPAAILLCQQIRSGEFAPASKSSAAMLQSRLEEQQGRLDMALAILLEQLKSEPLGESQAQCLLQAANLHARQNQTTEAAQLWEQYLAAYPTHPDHDSALYEWAWLALDQGNTQRAGELFERIHTECPASVHWPDATYRLARLAAQSGDRSQAEALCRLALTRAPSAPFKAHALYFLGQLQVKAGEWQAAQGFFQQLLDLPQAKLATADNQTTAANPIGPVAPAEDSGGTGAELQVTESNAADANAANAHGSDTHGSDTEKAIEPGLILAAKYYLAEADFQSGNLGTAQVRLRELADSKLAAQENWSVMVPIRLAQCLVSSESWEEAEQIARQALQPYASSDRAYELHYVLARCAASRGEFETAREMYRQIVRSKTGSKSETAAMAQWMMGESYYHQSNFTQAIREYLRVEILYAYPTWQAAALLQAGKCYEELGQPLEAANLYERLLQHYPDFEFVQEAESRHRAVTTATPARAAKARRGPASRTAKP